MFIFDSTAVFAFTIISYMCKYSGVVALTAVVVAAVVVCVVVDHDQPTNNEIKQETEGILALLREIQRDAKAHTC